MRLFSPVLLRPASRFTLGIEQSRYLTRALRLRVGDTLTLFDGSGGEYVATVACIGKSGVDVDTGEFTNRGLESPFPIRLVQGVSKGDRFDTVVQKATELGVSRISPVITDRCVTKLDGKRATKRRDHWQKISQSACEQCGRNIVMIVDEIMSLDDWHDENSEHNTERREGQPTRLILQHAAATALSLATRPDNGVTLLIGPEGGFSSIEYERAALTGFEAISLGPRVLRTETAAIATIATVQALWGDMLS